MKKTITTAILGVIASTVMAGSLTLVNVASPDINCVFNSNCGGVATSTTASFTIANTTGSGTLQTRTLPSDAASAGAGKYVYLYRLNLGGITAADSNACVKALNLNFGTPGTLAFITNGAGIGQVFVVTNTGAGSVVPISASENGGVVTLNFGTICAEQASAYFGLVSANGPGSTNAVLQLVAGSLAVDVRAPTNNTPPVTVCDLSALRAAIAQLANSEILAPNDNARKARRATLLDAVDSAISALANGDRSGVFGSLHLISNKAAGKGKEWVTDSAGQRIGALLDAYVNCSSR